SPLFPTRRRAVSEIKVVCERSRFPKVLEKLSENQRRLLSKVMQALGERTPPPALHYEKLKSHPHWRSVRLDAHSGYRVIFYEDDGYRVIAYVGAHDDAYNWATRNEPLFNQYGELEIRLTEMPSPPVPSSAPEPETLDPARFPFARYRASDLIKLGVPNEEWAEHLRQLSREDIEATINQMHNDNVISEPAFERFSLLAGGEPIEKLLPPAQLNLLVEECLEQSVRRGVLWKPEDWEELENYLQHPWERWLVFLNPSQREAAESRFSGPARVTGGPGTGKTVVALHRAKALAQRYAPQPVFLTSFNKALAAELRRRAERLKVPSNCLIKHLDEFVREQIKQFLPAVQVIYNTDELKNASSFDKLVREARFAYLPDFVWQEWEHVVDAWNIRTEEEYLQFERIGRGRALGPSERRAMWQVFEGMRRSLRNAMKMTPNQACYELARRFKNKPPFRCVIVDEAQDFGPAQMHLIQSLAPPDQPDNLFFCLDVAQRIYARSVPWTRYNINVRGRSRRLRFNYRNTLEIQQAAERVLPVEQQIQRAQSLDDPEVVAEAIRTGWRPIPMLRNPDAPPRLQPCKSRVDEAEKLKEWILECRAANIQYKQIAVVARTRDDLADMTAYLARELGVQVCELEQPASESAIYADTAHAIKGLEFRAVAIVAADRFPALSSGDPDFVQQEQNLLFMAMTRPRERLYVSWVGALPRFLTGLVEELGL
ncbi:MAG: UvrD-helicase domain-containing protein, partial [Fimbriimonadales bacterium]